MRKPIPPVKWWSPALHRKQRPNEEDTSLVGAIEYLWREAQTAFTIEQYEDYTIALRILWALREGFTTHPVETAYNYAVGVGPAKYFRLKLARQAHVTWQIANLRVGPVPQLKNFAKVLPMRIKKRLASVRPEKSVAQIAYR